MFDQIGRHRDDEANRRRATSAMLLTLGASGLLCVGAIVTGLQVAPPPPPAPPVELGEYLEPPPPPGIEIELPPAPVAAAALIQRGERQVEPRPTVPEEMVDTAPLPEVVPEQVVDAAPGVGDPDGSELGGEDGLPNGLQNGVPDGSGSEAGAPRVAEVHRSELRPRTLAEPSYPAAARGLDLGAVTCLVTVRVDDRGRPEDMDISGCPTVFHDEVGRAVSRSRWYPLRLAGQRTPARFTLAYRFTTGL